MQGLDKLYLAHQRALSAQSELLGSINVQPSSKIDLNDICSF